MNESNLKDAMAVLLSIIEEHHINGVNWMKRELDREDAIMEKIDLSVLDFEHYIYINTIGPYGDAIEPVVVASEEGFEEMCNECAEYYTKEQCISMMLEGDGWFRIKRNCAGCFCPTIVEEEMDDD